MTSFYDQMREIRNNLPQSELDQISQSIQNQLPIQQIQLSLNPHTRINPYYMQQQPMDSFAPMQMYQKYKATGQIPQSQSSFQPWSNPQVPVAPTPTVTPTVTPGIGSK